MRVVLRAGAGWGPVLSDAVWLLLVCVLVVPVALVPADGVGALVEAELIDPVAGLSDSLWVEP